MRIDGSHTGPHKNELLSLFQTDRAVLVALLSIKACGTGVDGLQHCADTGVFVELPETYALAHQAASRLHRSGQRHRVTIVFMFADGDGRSRGPRPRLCEPEPEGGGGEAAAVLRECEPADRRHWALLCRNEREIEHVFSGDVQRSESDTYTTAAGPVAAERRSTPSSIGCSGMGAGLL